MTKNNKMFGHRITLIRRLQPVAQLNGFAEGGLGEMDVINVGPFSGSSRRRALFTWSGLCTLSLNECNRQEAK
jgi:hypothetical protein